MPMRAACEPGLDLWRLVGRIVVHHEVDVWPLGDRGVDPLEEVEELGRSEEHTSELQSLMRISYAVFCLKKKSHRQKPRSRNRQAPQNVLKTTTVSTQRNNETHLFTTHTAHHTTK